MNRRNFFQSAGLGIATLFGLDKIAKLFGAETPVTPVASAATTNSYAGLWKAGMTKAEQQTTLLAQYMKTPAGRVLLAQSLGPSLRRRRDFHSKSRKALFVKQGHQINTLHRNVTLYTVDDEGGNILKYNDDQGRFHLPTFNLASNPMIPYSTVKEGKFDLVARSLNLSKAEIGGVEDELMFDLIDTATNAANDEKMVGNPDIPFDPQFNFLDVAQSNFDKHGVETMTYLFVNPRDYWKFQISSNPKFSRCCERKKLRSGHMGWIDTMEVHQSLRVKRGFMYVTGETEATQTGRVDFEQHEWDNSIRAGYIFEDTPLTVMCNDRPDLEQIGFRISQTAGIAVNPIAVQRVVVSVAEPQLATELPESL